MSSKLDSPLNKTLERIRFSSNQNIGEEESNLQNAYFKKLFVNINLENDPVSCVKVTGNLFITGHFSGLICLWSADLGKMIDVFENAHTNQITDVVFGNIFGKDEYILANDTGNSLSEVLIYSSINTQYHNRLFN